MKKLLLDIGLWLARRGGWSQYELPKRFLEALKIIAQIELKFPEESGEFKHHRALTALLNIGFTELDATYMIWYVVKHHL